LWVYQLVVGMYPFFLKVQRHFRWQEYNSHFLKCPGCT